MFFFRRIWVARDASCLCGRSSSIIYSLYFLPMGCKSNFYFFSVMLLFLMLCFFFKSCLYSILLFCRFKKYKNNNPVFFSLTRRARAQVYYDLRGPPRFTQRTCLFFPLCILLGVFFVRCAHIFLVHIAS